MVPLIVVVMIELSLSVDGVVSLDELFVACVVDLVSVGTVNV